MDIHQFHRDQHQHNDPLGEALDRLRVLSAVGAAAVRRLGEWVLWDAGATAPSNAALGEALDRLRTTPDVDQLRSTRRLADWGVWTDAAPSPTP